MSHKCRSDLSEISRHLRIGTVLLALALCVLGVTPGRADALNIIVQDSTAAPGTTGQFDVILQNDTGAVVNVASFSVDVLLPSAAPVSFTAVDNNTSSTYIFSGIPPSTTGSFAGFESLFSTAPPHEASGDDTAAAPSGQDVNAGASFGLAHVSYVVDAGASAGPIAVTLEISPVILPPMTAGTSLADSSGNPIQPPPTLMNGTITIASSAVPEPSALSMLAIAGGIVLAARRLRCARAK